MKYYLGGMMGHKFLCNDIFFIKSLSNVFRSRLIKFKSLKTLLLSLIFLSSSFAFSYVNPSDFKYHGGPSWDFGAYAFNWYGNSRSEFFEESSPVVQAQHTAAPAVLTLNQYRSNRVTGGGTGFLIDASGLALTNKHVVDDPNASYRALLVDGTEYTIEIKAVDPLLDVAIIQLISRGEVEEEPFHFPFVSLGDSSLLEIGESVVAIGNALAQYENTTTVGIISAKGRQLMAADALATAIDTARMALAPRRD